MAHELDYNTKTGTASMMYHGQVPWHGLGVPLDCPATAAEAIEAAGLDWDVSLEQLYTKRPYAAGLGALGFDKVDGRFATVRSDRNEVLGLVSQHYKPIQNKDCFSFFDGIVGEGKAIYHTVGSLQGGKRIWLLAKLPEDFEVVSGDRIESYILFSNSHDGTQAARAKFTNIRVVCRNTERAALGGDGMEGRIWHIGNLQQQFRHAASLMGLAAASAEKTKIAYEVMAAKMLTTDDVTGYFLKLVPDNPNAVKRHTRTDNTRSAMLHFFDNGAGSEFARGTVWNAYNAVTEYVTHARMGRSDPSRRLYSNWFSSGDDLNRRAFKEALALAS